MKKMSTSLLLSLSLLSFSIVASDEVGSIQTEIIPVPAAIESFYMGYTIQRVWYEGISDEQWDQIVVLAQEYKLALVAAKGLDALQIKQLEAEFNEAISQCTAQPAAWVNHVSVDPQADQIENELNEFVNNEAVRIMLAFKANEFSEDALRILTDALKEQFMNYRLTNEWDSEVAYQIVAFALAHQNS